MKELDILMENYLLNEYPKTSPETRIAFEKLLDYQDPTIIDLLFDRITDKDKDIQDLINQLKTYQAKNATI